jgi:acetyl-CoA carboxylase biotin carboxyl carrier protein
MGFPATAAQAAPVATAPAPGAPAPVSDERDYVITSPIVGTFYRASTPDAEPFVEVGDPVDADSVVCIVEAMKVMNEVRSEVSGTLEKVLVENGRPVEYGQPLFRVARA